MHGRWKRCRMILIFCLMCYLSVIRVSAAEDIPEGLPIIIRWEAGNGYDSSGNRITGGWAYDTVNEAGRYVLFDENGQVCRKVESWENRDETAEAFTSTEQESGIIALRLELFDGFAGEVTVTIESEKGVLGKYSLSSENLYEYNIPVPRGVYWIQKAEAADKRCIYAAEYPKEPFQLEEQGLKMLRIKVIDQEIGEVQSDNETMEIENQSEDTIDREREEHSMDRRKADPAGMTEEERKSPNLKYFLVGGVIVMILTIGLFLRGRKRKYH